METIWRFLSELFRQIRKSRLHKIRKKTNQLIVKM
jgi:hypothetical protein